MIPYGRQNVDDADIQAVVDVLRSDFLTQGPMVPRFEKAVAAYCGARHAIAVNSATSALHLACLALGVGPGDVVWTSPVTFVASANCALYCGANVDFVDIDPRTYNMNVECLETKLRQAESSGRLPKAVIPVHMCGQSCDMAAIHKLGQRYGFKVIEDASHAIGGRYCNQPVGNCRYSDITVFSFHPVKIITTGEGGMALTNDARLAETIASLRSHGITRDPARMTHEPDGAWGYEQIALGFNFRMTDIQAALGVSQIGRLDEFIARRHVLAGRYDAALQGLPVTIPYQAQEVYSSYHLYPIRVQASQRRMVFDILRSRGVGAQIHYIPVHTQPYYQAMGFRAGDYPHAEQYYAETISIPMFPSITDEQQSLVIHLVREAVS